MAYTYEKQLWKDYPDTTTPVTAERLNHMEDGISEAAKSGGGDTIPVGSEFDYDGTEVPEGFQQVDDPNEYSLTEKVVGTWRDGRPIYRKSFTATNLSTGLVKITHEIDNLDILVNGYGTFVRNDNVKGVLPYISITDLNYQFGINDINSTTLYLSVGTALTGTSLGIKTVDITLEYTKSTD